MGDSKRYAGDAPYDVIVVGAGICGVIFLKYALEQGLRCLVLDAQSEVGGLWAKLPAWQDLQNRKEDFAINDVPLDGVTQPFVQGHVLAWVTRYDLAPHIQLDCEVTSISRVDDRWNVETTSGTFRSDWVVAATGVQNEPWIPPVERSASEVLELHSSQLLQPEELADRTVTVVGGGASAYDMIELALTNGADSVHWLYRHARWFLPTRRSKQRAWPNLRELALSQTILRSPKAVSSFMWWQLRVLYRLFGLTDIQPTERFDFRKHQLIPARSSMLKHFDRIVRHRGEIGRIRGREIELADNAEDFETDVILWATGYRMNLRYLGLPELEGIDKADELLPRLGSLVRSVDYPELFFIGMSLTESTSSMPFIAAVEAKSIVAHIQGRCEIPIEPTPGRLAYWDLFRHFARFDDATYPPRTWKLKSALRGLWYGVLRNKPVKI